MIEFTKNHSFVLAEKIIQMIPTLQRKSTITIIGSVTDSRLTIRKDFSERMMSLLYYMQSSKEVLGINHMQELNIDGHSNIFDDDYASQDSNTSKFRKNKNIFNVLIANQGKRITLNNEGIECIVQFDRETQYNDRTHIKCMLVKIVLYGSAIDKLVTFLEECQEEYEHHMRTCLSKRLLYIVFDKMSDSDNKPQYNVREFHSNARIETLHNQHKTILMRRIQFFIDNKAWYEKSGTPHALGLLFSGSPGTGKTSCVKAIANYLRRHIVCVPMYKVDSMDMLENLFFNSYIDNILVPPESRLYVFEEIDCGGWEDVIADRKCKPAPKTSHQQNVTKGSHKPKTKLTLGGFLELLDGLMEDPGRIIIMTTNRPEMIDSAILRPGRVDLWLNFENPTEKDIFAMFSELLGVNLTARECKNIKQKDLSHAQIRKIMMDHMLDVNAVLSTIHELDDKIESPDSSYMSMSDKCG